MTEQHIDQVRQLSQWLAGTDITLLELSGPGRTIRLRRDGGSAAAGSGAALATAAAGDGAAAAAAAAATAPTVVRSGSVGIVLHAHPLRPEPLVRLGQQVATGQAVALLKIGLVLLAVVAPHAGKVARIVAGHDTAVGFGDALIEIE